LDTKDAAACRPSDIRTEPYYYRIDKRRESTTVHRSSNPSIADSKIIPAKTGAGESDLQARYLRFDNYTFLKASEERNHYKVRFGEPVPAASSHFIERKCQ